MKFSTREDIDAPVDAVFDALCDFERYERAAMRRGVEIRRMDSQGDPGEGAEWYTRFMMRGRERELSLVVTNFRRAEELVVGLSSQGIAGEANFELMALSPNKTRLFVSLELRPLTLPARLLLKSLKLTKTALDRRYKDRVSEYIAALHDDLHDRA